MTIKLEQHYLANLRTGHADNDGRSDLFISGGKRELVSIDPTTKEKTYRYSGLSVVANQGERRWNRPRRFETHEFSSFAVADLNGDALSDVVMCQADAEDKSLRIMWGNSEGDLKAKPTTELPVAYASCAAIADLNGDEKQDLVVGINQTQDTWHASSPILLGDGKGGFKPSADRVPTARPISVLVAPGVDESSEHRIVFCNILAGRIFEDVPAQVYWGGKEGFDKARMSNFFSRSGFCSSAADLNDDGFTELIMMAAVHAAKRNLPTWDSTFFGEANRVCKTRIEPSCLSLR